MPKRKDVVESFFRALSEARPEGFVQHLHDGVVYEFPEGLGIASRMEGLDTVAGFLAAVPKIYRPMDFHDVRLWEADDAVFAEFIVTGRAVKTGRDYNNRGLIVFEFRDERVIEMREHLNTLKVVEALRPEGDGPP